MKSRNPSSLSFRSRRLPDKLRIVKPIEGSLTLHNWSRLATPHLGGVLEERCGVAIKGNDKAGLDPLFDMYRLEEDEEEDDDDMLIPAVAQPTSTHFTFTNSTVLHPDTTYLTNMYPRTQMSSGVPSRNQSRLSSRCSSITNLSDTFPSAHLSNIGLVKIISEKKISSARRSQLDLSSSFGSVSSLTPSVLNSPYGSKKISPTCTPPHTPEESLPGSPDHNTDSGYVSSFFSSLKAAIYGQQRKQHRTTKFRQKLEYKRNALGIMEAVEEDPGQDKEGTPMSLPALSTIDEKSSKKSSSGAAAGGLSDFDALYLGVLDDYDELEEITPGMLTLTQVTEEDRDPEEYTKQWIGQLSVPSLASTGRPSLQSREFGKIPHTDSTLPSPATAVCNFGGRGPGRIVSPGEVRPGHYGPGLGVPGHPGTGAVGLAVVGGRRRDLGTIPGHSSEHQAVMESYQDPGAGMGMTHSTSFIGSITNMFFSRKGGY